MCFGFILTIAYQIKRISFHVLPNDVITGEANHKQHIYYAAQQGHNRPHIRIAVFSIRTNSDHLNPTQMIIEIASKEEIHIGDKTHHHDHDICPMSLRIINTIVKRPTNPTPPLDELDVFDISYPLLFHSYHFV